MKFKEIPKEYYITILDRLTRLEPANVRYKRVFDDIINKFSIDKKLKDLNLDEEINLVKEIVNKKANDDNFLADTIKKLEDDYFIKNELSKKYLGVDLNLEYLIKNIDENNVPKNVFWLQTVLKNKSNNLDLKALRENHSLLYPIEKIILCEGETENILLETLFKIFGFDLDKKGILVIASGGKNQVARKYYKMREYFKLPFFILLDKDAEQIKRLIQTKLRPKDKIYLIKTGEFEDIIPKEILTKTINYVHKNELNCSENDFSNELSMVCNLENIYKKYGFGEYKKADFARKLKDYIENFSNKEDFEQSEIKNILEELTK